MSFGDGSFDHRDTNRPPGARLPPALVWIRSFAAVTGLRHAQPALSRGSSTRALSRPIACRSSPSCARDSPCDPRPFVGRAVASWLGGRRGVAFGEGGKADFPSYISFKSYLSAYLAAVLGFSASVIFNFDLTMEAHMNVLANLRLELAFINAPR